MKSVLDGIQVDEKGFPMYPFQAPAGYITRAIVGACAKCGAPIYSEDFNTAKEPSVKHTCECNKEPLKSKSFEESICTK